MKNQQKPSHGEVTINIDINFGPAGFEPLDEEIVVSFPVKATREDRQQIVVPMTTARIMPSIAPLVRLTD